MSHGTYKYPIIEKPDYSELLIFSYQKLLLLKLAIKIDVWDAEATDKLIGLVQTYPALYDNANADHSNREIIEQVLQKIGVKLNKNERNTMSILKTCSEIEPVSSSSATEMETYVTDLGGFLHVMSEDTIPPPTPPEQPLPLDSDEDMEKENQYPLVVVETPKSKKPKTGEKQGAKDGVDEQFSSYLKMVQQDIKENKNKTIMELFLLSLVPDLNKLNKKSQTTFKIKTLELIEQLSEE